MELGKMEKYSVGYFIALNTIVKHWHNIFWYKKVTVTGEEELQKGVSYIITPNHQNALMDALILAATSSFQIVWLARADIFNNKFSSPILRFFRIMPVYRLRDGVSNLGKNEAIFNKSIDVLKNKFPLALFPETTHWGYRRLRATKKAVPRIAFMAEEENNFNLDIHIVPCGIYYEAYQPARSKVLLQYGKPFPIKEYIELYKENKNKGYQALRKRIEKEIKPLIIDIQHDKFYDCYEELRNIYDDTIIYKRKLSGKEMLKKFSADKILISTLDLELAQNEEKISVLASKTDAYKKLKTHLRLNELTIKNKDSKPFEIIWEIMKTIVFLPIFVYGFVFNFIPYYIPLTITKKKVEDPQFVSSFNFALIVITFPVFYIFYIALFVSLTNVAWFWSIAFFATLLFSAIFAIDYFNSVKALVMKIRYTFLRIKKDESLISLMKLRKEITTTLDHIFTAQETKE